MLDLLHAAAAAYRTAAELDERLQVAAVTGHLDQGEEGIDFLRDLASSLYREAWTAFRHLVAARAAPRRATELGFRMRVDLSPVAELRRGLEVRPGLADLDALAARGTRVREEADARLFAVSRLLETVSGMPFVNNVISQFSRALSTALASAPQAVPVPSSGPEKRERFVVGIDRVRAPLTNLAGEDLRDADLDGVPLVGDDPVAAEPARADHGRFCPSGRRPVSDHRPGTLSLGLGRASVAETEVSGRRSDVTVPDDTGVATDQGLLTNADLAVWFALSTRETVRLAARPGFPAAINGRWKRREIIRWVASIRSREFAGRIPLEHQRPARAPARYLGARHGDGALTYLAWFSCAGLVVLAYVTGQDFNAGLVCTDDELPFPDPYVVVKVTTWVNAWVETDLPTLEVHYPEVPPVELDCDMMTTWRQLAAFLGQAIPLFPPLLRRRDLLERWRPGAEPAIALPVVPDHEVATFYKTVATENDPNSVVARTLIDLGHARLGAAIRHTEAAVAEIENLDVDYCATIAARPATVVDRAYDDRRVPEQDRRAAWMDLFHRTDELPAECVEIGYILDGRRCFPYTHIAAFRKDELQRFQDNLSHSVVQERLARLQPSPRTAGHQRIEDKASTDRMRYLEDPATGAPVIEQTSAYGFGMTRVVTLIPERLPTTDALAEVILEGTAWIRTTSGTLYLMPVLEGVTGHAWGYGGSGPGALAATIEALLDDITAAPGHQELGAEVSSLTKRITGDGVVLDRATLDAPNALPFGGTAISAPLSPSGTPNGSRWGVVVPVGRLSFPAGRIVNTLRSTPPAHLSVTSTTTGARSFAVRNAESPEW